MQLQMLDFDGAISRQAPASSRTPPWRIDLTDWGPHLRLACSFGRFRRFERDLASRLRDEAQFNLCGSGDFHHVSLALLRRLQRPCNVLVLDNHPDWMRGVPFLHCGTWLYHAARLPHVQRIFHAGGDVDFDNAYRWMAPWPELHSGKITTFGAMRPFRRGSWQGVPNEPLRGNGQPMVCPERLEKLLHPCMDDLARFPLYVSVDKDVLRASEAAVNWDSGHLGLDDLRCILTAFFRAAGGRLAGMDTVGDWSPVQVRGVFRQALHWTEHPRLQIDAETGARRNERVNRVLVETVETCCGRMLAA